jgi:hypothetical protein
LKDTCIKEKKSFVNQCPVSLFVCAADAASARPSPIRLLGVAVARVLARRRRRLLLPAAKETAKDAAAARAAGSPIPRPI